MLFIEKPPANSNTTRSSSGVAWSQQSVKVVKERGCDSCSAL